MSAATLNHSTTADREITATRVFDAPRDLVWEAWTDPKHIAQWWGPIGFRNTIVSMDVRPGGIWDFVMHGPDGRDYDNKIRYVEIVRPERIVYDHCSAPNFHVTVNFAEEGRKTRLTMTMLFETAELRDGVAKAYGAVEGLQQTLGRLAEHLAGTAPHSVRVVRTFDAPRARVFAAWTDSKQLAKWFGPHRFTNPVCEIDARPGGDIRIEMRGPDGVTYPHRGTVTDLAAPERLSFTLDLLGDDGQPLIQATIAASFHDANGKTRVELDAQFRSVPEMAAAIARAEEGWTQSFERLAGVALTDERKLVVTRVFDAPREVVFDAWTQEEHLRRWWSPKTFTTSHVKVDLRVGGLFHYCMRAPDGKEYWGRGIYREIVRPERIVYSDSFADAEGNAVDPSHYGISDAEPDSQEVTITFREERGKTRVTLEHAIPAGTHRDGAGQGWNEMLDKLEGAVG